MTTPSFIPGLELSRRFYLEAVRPLLDEIVPGVTHSAARLGSGSEVLGFDTARSADHEWGPARRSSRTRRTSPVTLRKSEGAVEQRLRPLLGQVEAVSDESPQS